MDGCRLMAHGTGVGTTTARQRNVKRRLITSIDDMIPTARTRAYHIHRNVETNTHTRDTIRTAQNTAEPRRTRPEVERRIDTTSSALTGHHLRIVCVWPRHIPEVRTDPYTPDYQGASRTTGRNAETTRLGTNNLERNTQNQSIRRRTWWQKKRESLQSTLQKGTGR